MATRTKASKASGRTLPERSAVAACGCGVRAWEAGARRGESRSAAAPGVGPGFYAVGVDAGLKAANVKHLRRIEGQVRGIAAMVDEDRYCADIITQISAVRQSLHAVARNLLRNHLTHCAAAAMREGGPEHDEMTEEVLDLIAKVTR